jgi:ribulose-phosphate 3-epimerase
MDGGIYLENVKEVLSAGVNVVVAGTSVFGASNPVAAVKEFYEAFDKHQYAI